MNLWDCGGQDSFYESYFNHQQDFIFRSVEVSRKNTGGGGSNSKTRRCGAV